MKNFSAFLVLSILFLAAFEPHTLNAASCLQDAAVAEAPLSSTAQSIQALNLQLYGASGASMPRIAAGPQQHTLLANRLALMETLMREHPAEVRAVMIDPAKAAELIAADAGAAPYLEQPRELTGELTETVADDFAHGTATFHFGLHTATGELELVPARTLALATMLHQTVTVSGVATPAVMALDTAGGARVQALLEMPRQAAATTPLACSTTGVQKTVVLLLKFAGSTLSFPTGLDTAAYWQQAVAGPTSPSVTTYWNEVSYGQTSATVDVFGPLTLPQVYDCTTTGAMYTAAVAAAAGTVDFSQYTRIVLVYPAATCTFGGLGSVGCGGATAAINHPSSVVWIPLLPGYSLTFPNLSGDLTHELGHNLGLNHANTLDFGGISLGPIDFQATNPGTVGGTGSTTATGAITGVDTEYGDDFSTMGGSAYGASGPYSAHHRTSVLKWIPYTDSMTITASSTVTLVPAENTTGLRSLRVLRDPIASSWLWLEYHQPSSPYAAANLAMNKGNNMTQGAMIQYENGFADPLHTYQMDMTPVAVSNNFIDGGLVAGKSWSDPYSLLTITTNTATASGLNVSVKYDTPCAALALSAPVIPAAGGTGTLTITAPSSCTWTASSNAPWITLTGTTTGAGNATIPFTAAANTTTDQRNTYITAQRQSVPLVQDGTTVDLLSLTPSTGTAAVGVSTIFTLTGDDAAGFTDLGQVNVNVGGAICPVAVVFSGTTPFFYLYNGTAYTSGLSGGTVGTISAPGCTLSGKNSGLVVTGNSFSIAMDLSFAAPALGAQPINANAYGKVHSSNRIPLGTFVVTNSTTTSPQMTLSPSSGNPGSAVPVTFNGTGTHFDATSAVSFDATTITASGVAAANATTLTATLTLAAGTSVGTHTITVTTGSEVVTAPFIVSNAVLTSTTLTASASTVLPGTSVTFTATVAGGTPKPTGTVTFTDGTTTLGTGTLSAGVATYAAAALGVGAHAVAANYSGDSTYSPSTSTSVVVTVAAVTPTLAVTVSAPVAFPGTAVVLTANVASMAGTPGGTVTFFDGTASTPLGTGTLANGTAALSLTNLGTGPHAIGAMYGGSSSFNAVSTTATVAVSVADFALTAPAGITFSAGAGMGDTATMTLTPGSGGFPSSVTLTCSGAPAAATCAVNPGSVTPGAANATAVVTISTTARSAIEMGPATFYLAMGLAPLPFFGLTALLLRRRLGRAGYGVLLFVALLGTALGLNGCSSSTPPPSSNPTGPTGTPAGVSTITVTGTATGAGGTLTHTATFSVTVN